MKTKTFSVASARPLVSSEHPIVLLAFERVRRIRRELPIILAILGFVVWLALSVMLMRSLVMWWADLENSALHLGYVAYLR